MDENTNKNNAEHKKEPNKIIILKEEKKHQPHLKTFI